MQLVSQPIPGPLPLDLVEQLAKSTAVGLIHHLDKGNSPEEMGREVLVAFSILITGALPKAVRQCRLKPIVVCSGHV